MFVPLGTIHEPFVLRRSVLKGTQAETPLVTPDTRAAGQDQSLHARRHLHRERLEAEEPREVPFLQRVQSLAARPRCGDPQVQGMLAVQSTAPGLRLGCHCRPQERCHGDATIDEFSTTFPLAFDHSSTQIPPTSDTMNYPALRKVVSCPLDAGSVKALKNLIVGDLGRVGFVLSRDPSDRTDKLIDDRFLSLLLGAAGDPEVGLWRLLEGSQSGVRPLEPECRASHHFANLKQSGGWHLGQVLWTNSTAIKMGTQFGAAIARRSTSFLKRWSRSSTTKLGEARSSS